MINRFRSIIALTLAAFAFTGSGYAQSYYDDDIYYDASKARQEKEKKKKEQQKKNDAARTSAEKSWSYTSTLQPLPGSDTYIFSTDNNRDVDEYNRRNVNPVSNDTVPEEENFTYTQRIERFYNPEIVTGSNDNELKEVYAYTVDEPAPTATTVNIYLEPSYSWYSPWYGWNSWYGPSWAYWDPWYAGYWGPGWSLSWGPSWGWGPSWSWSWGWGPSWGWGAPLPPPVHHPGYIPSRPSRPVISNGGRRPGNGSIATAPSYNGMRPGSTAGRRPGYGTTRPGYGTARPSGSGNSQNIGVSGGRRPGANGTVSNSHNNTSSNRWDNNSSSWNNSNSHSSGGYRSGSSGFGGGSRSGFGGGGGGRGGGGRRR